MGQLQQSKKSINVNSYTIKNGKLSVTVRTVKQARITREQIANAKEEYFFRKFTELVNQ